MASFSSGATMFTGVETLEAEVKTGSGKETVEPPEGNATVDTGTSMAFSIRLCTVVGSMTFWLSSGVVTTVSSDFTSAAV